MTLLGLRPGLAAPAAPPPWTAFGPGGGSVLSLAVDPAHPSTIYTAGSKVLRSTDGGGRWTDVTPPPATERHSIHSLAVAPSGVAFAADGETLLRSADGGGTWSAVLSEQVVFAPLTVLVSPSDASHVYAASRESIYVSSDGGATFTPAAKPATTPDQSLGGFVLAPSFAQPQGRWAPFGPGGGTPTGLAVDPRNPSVVYAAANTLFRGDDGGETWTALFGPGVKTVALDPANPSIIYAGGSELARSTPFGETLDVESLAADPSRPGFLYAGTYERGVARSANGGERWRIGVEPGLNEGPVALLKIHPGRPGAYYVGLATRGDRSFRSPDGGLTWQPFARDIGRDGLLDLGFDPRNPDRLYAANEDGLWESRDGGTTWDRIDTASTYRIAVPKPGTLLSGRICGLSRSPDDGSTWQRVVSCDLPGNDDVGVGVVEIWIDPRNPRNILVWMQGSNGGSSFASFLVRSADGGATWKTLKGFPSLVAVAPSDFRTLYMADLRNGQILRSRDSGITWRVVQAQSPYPDFYGAMAVDATDPNTLYVASFQKGVLRSQDGGVTLRRLGAPFEDARPALKLLLTDRGHPGVVWAAPLDGGLFWGRFE
jgi:photosystem II stability/assembly factor-like uncharacterized protein